MTINVFIAYTYYTDKVYSRVANHHLLKYLKSAILLRCFDVVLWIKEVRHRRIWGNL